MLCFSTGLVSTGTAKLKCYYFLYYSNFFVASKKLKNSEYFVIRVKTLVIFATLFPVENRSNPDFYRLNRASRNSPAVPAESAEVVSGSAAQTPPPHAPGIRMTGVTPSNYIILYYIISYYIIF